MLKEFLEAYGTFFLQGALVTLIASAIAVFFGVIFGFLIAMLKRSKIAPLRGIASVYIEVMRGTPAMLQVMLVYYGLTAIFNFPSVIIGGIDMSRFLPGCLALALNSGAYVAEIIRSGINSVEAGQTEAAYSLGMRPRMTMMEIIMPQAMRTIFPALGNEFVTVIKESSVLTMISVEELMRRTDIVLNSSYRAVLSLCIGGFLYLVMTFITSRIVAYFEKRSNKGVRKVS